MAHHLGLWIGVAQRRLEQVQRVLRPGGVQRDAMLGVVEHHQEIDVNIKEWKEVLIFS